MQTLQKQYYIPEKNLLAAVKRQPKVRVGNRHLLQFQKLHQHRTVVS